jgi:hypothetical protein
MSRINSPFGVEAVCLHETPQSTIDVSGQSLSGVARAPHPSIRFRLQKIPSTFAARAV